MSGTPDSAQAGQPTAKDAAAGSPFLPLPCPALDGFTLTARVRPVMGSAGLLFRSGGAGTGLLLEVTAGGSVVLRPAVAWEIGASAVPASDALATGQLEKAGLGGSQRDSWLDLTLQDDGQTVTATLNGHLVIRTHIQREPSSGKRLALHQGPGSQAEVKVLRVADASGTVVLRQQF